MAAAFASPASTRPPPFYDAAGDCFRPASADDAGLELVVDGGPWEVWARPAQRSRANDVAKVIRGVNALNANLWSYFRSRLGGDLPDGGRTPYRIYIYPISGDGLLAPECANARRTAAFINSGAIINRIETVAAHELFHAFQHASSRPLRRDTTHWFLEATATWAHNLASPIRNLANRARKFTDHPRRALDLVEPGKDADTNVRQYAAFAFISWLDEELGRAAVWKLMRDTFHRWDRNGDTHTEALRHVLAGMGRELGRDLAGFWARQLTRTSPWPRTEGVTEKIEIGTRTVMYRRDALEAEVIQFRPVPAVRSIRLTFPGVARNTYLFVQNGVDLQDWSTGQDAFFCVGGGGRAGYTTWPGNFAVAWTNGGPADNEKLQVTMVGSAEPCDRQQLAPAIDRYPPAFGDEGWHYIWQKREVNAGGVPDLEIYQVVVGRKCGRSKFGVWRFTYGIEILSLPPDPLPILSFAVESVFEVELTPDGAENPLRQLSRRTIRLVPSDLPTTFVPAGFPDLANAGPSISGSARFAPAHDGPGAIHFSNQRPGYLDTPAIRAGC